MAEKRTNRRRLLTDSQKTRSSKPLILSRLPVLSQYHLLRLAALAHHYHATGVDIGGIEGGYGSRMKESAGEVVDAYRSVGSVVAGGINRTY